MLNGGGNVELFAVAAGVLLGDGELGVVDERGGLGGDGLEQVVVDLGELSGIEPAVEISTPRISPAATPSESPGWRADSERRRRSGMQMTVRMLCATMLSQRAPDSAVSVSVIMYSPAVRVACWMAVRERVESSASTSPVEERPTARFRLPASSTRKT